MPQDNNGYDKESNATCCVGCKHYIEHGNDYAECAEDAGYPFGEWVQGKCAARQA